MPNFHISANSQSTSSPKRDQAGPLSSASHRATPLHSSSRWRSLFYLSPPMILQRYALRASNSRECETDITFLTAGFLTPMESNCTVDMNRSEPLRECVYFKVHTANVVQGPLPSPIGSRLRRTLIHEFPWSVAIHHFENTWPTGAWGPASRCRGSNHDATCFPSMHAIIKTAEERA